MADIVRLWDRATQAANDRLRKRGQIGRINASGPPTVEVPGSGGRLVYVRLGPGGADGDIMAVPRGVPKRAHVYVLCHKEDGQWVAELDTSAVNQNGAGSAGVAPHTHRRHSGLEYVSEAELFAPGVVLPAGGLTVSIGRFRYPNSANGETYEGGTLDLTSHVPATAGKWRWVLVGVDPSTNAAVAVSGSDFDTQAELTLAEIDNVAFTGDIPLAAIQVANGDTALTDHSRYYDARPWFVPADAMDRGDFLLLAGRSGGQTAYGGTDANDSLLFHSTVHATRGTIALEPNPDTVENGPKIAIGTPTVPDEFVNLYLLGVNGAWMKIHSTTGDANLQLWADGDDFARLMLHQQDGVHWEIGMPQDASGNLIIGGMAMSPAFLTMTPTGNVGIGPAATSPGSLVTIGRTTDGLETARIDNVSTGTSCAARLVVGSDASGAFGMWRIGANATLWSTSYGQAGEAVIHVDDLNNPVTMAFTRRASGGAFVWRAGSSPGSNSSAQMYLGHNGNLGIGPNVTSPSAKTHIDQASTTAAIPVLLLDQADLSEEFIQFDTTVGTGNPIDTAVLGSYYGKIRVSVNGTFRYIPLYSS